MSEDAVILGQQRIRNFRNFSQQVIEFTHPWTAVIGPNGSGKTNLIESIFFACRLRGFRNESWTKLRQWDTQEGYIESAWHSLDVERSISWQGRVLQLTEDEDTSPSRRVWACTIPIFGYRPDDDLFFHEEPRTRRRYLDWVCAYLDAGYMQIVSQYEQALRQRNTALRARNLSALEHRVWEEQLATSGAELVRQREAALLELRGQYEQLWSAMELADAEVCYQSAGSTSVDQCMQALEQNRHTDAERGWTQFGPHRDDLALLFSGRPIKESGSQGQRKIAVVLLALSCSEVVRKARSDQTALFYLDDIDGELDHNNESKLFHILASHPLQVFLTGVHRLPILSDLGLDGRTQWIDLA